MSPVDRVPQILVAVSARPSSRPSDEVAVAVRVGPSVRPPANRAAAGEGVSARRDARTFEDRTPTRSRSLPPLVSSRGAEEVVDWEQAEVGQEAFDGPAEWVQVSAAGRPASTAPEAAVATTSAYLTAGADVASMRSLLAKRRAHSAYSLAPGGLPAAPQGGSRQSPPGAASARLHVVA